MKNIHTKHISLALALFILLSLFALCSCGGNDDGDGKLSVVSTIFPSYDFAKQIGKDKANVKMLLPPGSESHSYEPSMKDIIAIRQCDLFIYVGGVSDSWVDAILDSFDKKPRTLKLMDCVEAREEEVVEGMEHEDDGDDDDGHSENDLEYDEHVWTSLKNAADIVDAICKEMSDADPENADAYGENAASYKKEILDLESRFAGYVSSKENIIMIFGDRFPFLYFAKDYGIEYYAAFQGCSTDTEPKTKTVAFLQDKVRSSGVGTVFYIEFSNHKIADSIAEHTGAKTALFHSCHNVSYEQISAGTTYVSLMEENLETLKRAFG